MRHITSAGGIVLNPNRQVLVVTNQIGKHTFPKGERETGETPEENALREIHEESGLTRIEVICYLGLVSRMGFTANNDRFPSVKKHIDMFFCITGEIALCPLASDVVEANWVAPDNLADLLTWQEEADFFEQKRWAIGI